jgi:hypothetical protein
MSFCSSCFFGRKVGPDALIPLVEAARDTASQMLSFFAMNEQALLTEFESDPNSAYWLMTLRSGILVTQARVEWADETLATLRKLQKRRSVRGDRA